MYAHFFIVPSSKHVIGSIKMKLTIPWVKESIKIQSHLEDKFKICSTRMDGQHSKYVFLVALSLCTKVVEVV